MTPWRVLWILSTICICLALFNISPAQAASTKNGFPVIKGLYLSMPKGEAELAMKKLLRDERRNFPDMEYYADEDGVELWEVSEDIYNLYVWVRFDDNGKAWCILFNTAFFNAPPDLVRDREFASGFSKAYDIPLTEIDVYLAKKLGLDDLMPSYMYLAPGQTWGVVLHILDDANDGSYRAVTLVRRAGKESEMRF